MFQQNWVLVLIAILALNNGQGPDPKQGPSSEMEKLARAKKLKARRSRPSMGYGPAKNGPRSRSPTHGPGALW